MIALHSIKLKYFTFAWMLFYWLTNSNAQYYLIIANRFHFHFFEMKLQKTEIIISSLPYFFVNYCYLLLILVSEMFPTVPITMIFQRMVCLEKFLTIRTWKCFGRTMRFDMWFQMGKHSKHQAYIQIYKTNR